jgi:hypothetical protein
MISSAFLEKAAINCGDGGGAHGFANQYRLMGHPNLCRDQDCAVGAILPLLGNEVLRQPDGRPTYPR